MQRRTRRLRHLERRAADLAAAEATVAWLTSLEETAAATKAHRDEMDRAKDQESHQRSEMKAVTLALGVMQTEVHEAATRASAARHALLDKLAGNPPPPAGGPTITN